MDDLISRQAAIDVVSDLYWMDERLLNFKKEIDATFDKIKALPSAQQWISCSERLPEYLEEVNVTWVNHAPEQYYDFVKDKHFTGSAVYYKGLWYWYSSTCVDILAEYGRNEMDKMDDGIEVVAWMPLPEPYKGAKDE